MSVNDLVLVRGMSDTRRALERWNARPVPVLGSWLAGSTAIALGLLGAVWLVASVADPDPTPLYLPGLSGEAGLGDALHVLARNSIVLALHAVACVAGFIAGSSLPLSAEHRSGLSRWVHDKARPVALGWVVLVTSFSLVTQAFILGSDGSTLAAQLGISPGELIVSVLPHALPELVAVFLPLAAWTIASRHNSWDELLAATVATVAVAIPVLVVAAIVETYVWPLILAELSPFVS